jgi:hypothetical protein
MRRIIVALALGLPLICVADPASARSGGGRSGDSRIDLTAPGPAQFLDQAMAALQRGDLRAASSGVEIAQHRLLTDSLASNLPYVANAMSMRDAAQVLNGARQALFFGDAAGAAQAIAAARGML